MNNENYPLDFEFKDSTFVSYQFNISKGSYEIIKEKDTAFILLNNELCYISQSKNELFDFLLIGRMYKDTFKLKERKPTWKLNGLYGKWIEENPTQTELDSLPFYSIEKTGITFHKKDEQIESKLNVNSSYEYIEINLTHSSTKIETMWRIKNLTDSTMVIDRTTNSSPIEYGIHNDIKLIKKR